MQMYKILWDTNFQEKKLIITTKKIIHSYCVYIIIMSCRLDTLYYILVYNISREL